MPEALRPGERWSLDFLSDTFGASRRFRILAVNDDCCRENLCLMADTSISGARVARELDALVRVYGRPVSIVSDNGTEFTSRAILEELRPDFLKLDVSLVRKIDQNLIKQELLRSLVRIATRIGSSVIAEGVETWDEARALTEAGAQYGQGHLFAPPTARVDELGGRAP